MDIEQQPLWKKCRTVPKRELVQVCLLWIYHLLQEPYRDKTVVSEWSILDLINLHAGEGASLTV